MQELLIKCESSMARFWIRENEVSYQDGYNGDTILLIVEKSFKSVNIGIGYAGGTIENIEQEPVITLFHSPFLSVIPKSKEILISYWISGECLHFYLSKPK